MLDFIGTVLAPLVSPFENIGQGLTEIRDKVFNIPQLIVDGISQTLRWLFIPNENYFNNKFDEIKELLNSKIGMQQYINIFGQIKTTGEESSGLKINVYGKEVTIVDFSWIYAYKSSFNIFFRGFFIVLLILYNINQIYFLIRGTHLIKILGSGGEK